MKNLMKSLCVVLLVFAQQANAQVSEKSNANDLKDMSITVEVDSAEELEKALGINAIKELLSLAGGNEDISLTITCNKEPNENGIKPSLSLKITGNTGKPDEFIKQTEYIKKAAMESYKEK